tara:strand:+ start:18 stop:218 length:201 start_codon:yes stop_codon:yes gene_type:complete
LAKIEEINHFKTKIQDDIEGIKNDYETQQEQMREEHRKKDIMIEEKHNEIKSIQQDLNQRDETIRQ